MAFRSASYADLRIGDSVILSLREGESVIVGTVTEHTEGGGLRVALKNNRNSVVIYRGTNFRIEVDRGPTAADVLDDLDVGTVFDYDNKYGNTVRFVKSGSDRYTRVDNERPATSFSRAGFPAEDPSVITLVSLVESASF